VCSAALHCAWRACGRARSSGEGGCALTPCCRRCVALAARRAGRCRGWPRR
jgi:hypothetical protein